MAARRRRQQEVAREEGFMNLDEIELPENHPFAVKKSLSQGTVGNSCYPFCGVACFASYQKSLYISLTLS